MLFTVRKQSHELPHHPPFFSSFGYTTTFSFSILSISLLLLTRLEQVSCSTAAAWGKVKLISFIQKERLSSIEEPVLTHFASEKVLAEDWLSPEEDEAWQDL